MVRINAHNILRWSITDWLKYKIGVQFNFLASNVSNLEITICNLHQKMTIDLCVCTRFAHVKPIASQRDINRMRKSWIFRFYFSLTRAIDTEIIALIWRLFSWIACMRRRLLRQFCFCFLFVHSFCTEWVDVVASFASADIIRVIIIFVPFWYISQKQKLLLLFIQSYNILISPFCPSPRISFFTSRPSCLREIRFFLWLRHKLARFFYLCDIEHKFSISCMPSPSLPPPLYDICAI